MKISILFLILLITQTSVAAKRKCGGAIVPASDEAPVTALAVVKPSEEIARPMLELQDFKPVGFETLFGRTVKSRSLENDRYIRHDASIFASKNGQGEVLFGATSEPAPRDSTAALVAIPARPNTQLASTPKNQGLVPVEQLLTPVANAGNLVARESGTKSEEGRVEG